MQRTLACYSTFMKERSITAQQPSRSKKTFLPAWMCAINMAVCARRSALLLTFMVHENCTGLYHGYIVYRGWRYAFFKIKGIRAHHAALAAMAAAAGIHYRCGRNITGHIAAACKLAHAGSLGYHCFADPGVSGECSDDDELFQLQQTNKMADGAAATPSAGTDMVGLVVHAEVTS